MVVKTYRLEPFAPLDIQVEEHLHTYPGFSLAPSNIDLAGAEVELKQLLAALTCCRARMK